LIAILPRRADKSRALTLLGGHDTMLNAKSRARSSTAEQWPFKPLVLGSNPSALTPSIRFWRIFC
jgi:hypothetical protein